MFGGLLEVGIAQRCGSSTEFASRAACTVDGPLRGVPVGRMIVVTHVVTGQRIPLPRAADGTCPRRIPSVEVDGASRALPIEFEPAGCLEKNPATCTHWIQHDIGEESSTHFDTATCEVVVDEAIARDAVHRKILRHATPLQIDHFLGQPPSSADLMNPGTPTRSERRDADP